MVEEGELAPDFTLPGVDDFRSTDCSLSEQLRATAFYGLSFYV
ncbi:MAG: hypothetical protein ABEH59_00085 [Halobacteriales archaeon]